MEAQGHKHFTGAQPIPSTSLTHEGHKRNILNK